MMIFSMINQHSFFIIHENSLMKKMIGEILLYENWIFLILVTAAFRYLCLSCFYNAWWYHILTQITVILNMLSVFNQNREKNLWLILFLTCCSINYHFMCHFWSWNLIWGLLFWQWWGSLEKWCCEWSSDLTWTVKISCI